MSVRLGICQAFLITAFRAGFDNIKPSLELVISEDLSLFFKADLIFKLRTSLYDFSFISQIAFRDSGILSVLFIQYLHRGCHPEMFCKSFAEIYGNNFRFFFYICQMFIIPAKQNINFKNSRDSNMQRIFDLI